MIDHCADWDYIWLTMLGRARKHTRTFDWSTVAPQIFHAANRIVQVLKCLLLLCNTVYYVLDNTVGPPSSNAIGN